MKIEAPEKVHFPGLNTLRFLAALSVLIGHVELTKNYLQIQPNSFSLFERINFGGIGVYFFFVLSGFLITYLLCVEKKTDNGISIKHFYLRRILRIWPLYFLIVLLGFFILPLFDFFQLFPGAFHHDFYKNLILYLLILPNLAFSMYNPVPHIGQAWSIGVEEQFYIFWPVVLKYSRNTAKTICILLVSYVLLKAGLVLYGKIFGESAEFIVVKKFFAMSKFECMMIGGMGAVILYAKKENLLRIIFHPLVQVTALIFFPLLSFLAGTTGFLQDIIHLPLSILFLVIILNTAANPNSFFKLENKLLDHLGKISFGIYMYHLFVVFAVVKFSAPYFSSYPVLANVIAYLGSTVISCVIAHLSYNYFEKYFIKLKTRFSKVHSG